MIHLGEFLSWRCPVWYTRGSLLLTVPVISNPCDLPGMRHRYGGDLLKELQGRKDDIPLVTVLESNYVAFWMDNPIFFGCVLNCSLSFTPLNLFQQIEFSMCRRILSEHTQSKWKCTSSFFGLPFRSLLSYTRPNSFAKLCNAFLYRSFPFALVSSSISSLRFTLAVRLSKPFRCLWTQLSLCVMALRTRIKDKRGLVEPLYWF